MSLNAGSQLHSWSQLVFNSFDHSQCSTALISAYAASLITVTVFNSFDHCFCYLITVLNSFDQSSCSLLWSVSVQQLWSVLLSSDHSQCSTALISTSVLSSADHSQCSTALISASVLSSDHSVQQLWSVLLFFPLVTVSVQQLQVKFFHRAWVVVYVQKTDIYVCCACSCDRYIIYCAWVSVCIFKWQINVHSAGVCACSNDRYMFAVHVQVTDTHLLCMGECMHVQVTDKCLLCMGSCV